MFKREKPEERPLSNRNNLNVGGNGQTSSNNQFASGATNVEFSRERNFDENRNNRNENRNQNNRVEFAKENNFDEECRDCRDDRNQQNNRTEFAREEDFRRDPNPGSTQQRNQTHQNNKDDSYYDLT